MLREFPLRFAAEAIGLSLSIITINMLHNCRSTVCTSEGYIFVIYFVLQMRALGNEGMITEMLQYFHLAETLLLHPKSYSRTAMYNNVLHSLVDAREVSCCILEWSRIFYNGNKYMIIYIFVIFFQMQGRMAVEVFLEMKDGDFPPDSTTYNIMINCCSILGSFKSACALVSMMLRSGYSPQAVTYTALLKVFSEDFFITEELHPHKFYIIQDGNNLWRP